MNLIIARDYVIGRVGNTRSLVLGQSLTNPAAPITLTNAAVTS